MYEFNTGIDQRVLTSPIMDFMVHRECFGYVLVFVLYTRTSF